MSQYPEEDGQQMEAEWPEAVAEPGPGRGNGAELPDNAGENSRRLPESIPGPFLRETPLPGRGYRHDGGAQSASVVFYEGGGCTVYTVNGPHEVRERRWWARPLSVCHVACGRHITTFEVRLPAAGAATFFVTKVTLRWQVTDYERVAVNQLASVERDLGEEIVDRLREVSERYPVREAQQANTAIRADIRAGRWRDLGAEVGLSAELFVDVGTDEVILDQVREARTDEGEEQRVGRRFAAYSKLAAGSASDRLAYLMASGTKQDVKGVITMMQEDDAQGRSDTRDFFLRMLEQDRITSPELEAHLRSLILPGQRSTDPQYVALAERALPPAPPPRLSLPPGSSGSGGGEQPRSGTGRQEPPWPSADAGSRGGPPREGRVWNDGSWVDEYEDGVSVADADAGGGRAGSGRRPERDLWDDDDSYGSARAEPPGGEPGRGRTSSGGRSGDGGPSRGRPQGGRSDGEGSRGRSGPDSSGPVRSGSGWSASDRSGPDRSGPDRSGSDRSGSDRSGSDRFGSDRFGSDRGSRGRSSDAHDADSRTADRWSSSGRSDRGRSDDQVWQGRPRVVRDGDGDGDRDRDRDWSDSSRDRGDRGSSARAGRDDRPRDGRDASRRPGGPRPVGGRSEGTRAGDERSERGRTHRDPSWDDEERDRSGGPRRAGDRGREDWSRDDAGRDDRRRDDRSWDGPDGRSGSGRPGGDAGRNGRSDVDRGRDGSSREDRYRGDRRRDDRPRDDGGRDSRDVPDRHRDRDRDRHRDQERDRERDDRYRDEPSRRSDDRQERGGDYWSVSDDERGRG
ncbi:hypothetical protein [Streptomyces sp. NPDC059076]|uniref:hypothetical protein n=1 Tax=unclassified Streptomyces TaxID=2593676 RepID=UPI003696C68C